MVDGDTASHVIRGIKRPLEAVSPPSLPLSLLVSRSFGTRRNEVKHERSEGSSLSTPSIPLSPPLRGPSGVGER